MNNMKKICLCLAIAYLSIACDQKQSKSIDMQVQIPMDQTINDQHLMDMSLPVTDMMTASNCAPSSFYQPGVKAFEEKTQEMNLTGVEGTLMTVADINQDHWPDLIVRRGGVNADVLDEGGKRNTWVFINRNGVFEDFTTESNFLAVRGNYPINVGRPNWVVTLGDIDNDGDLDAYSGIDMRNPPQITTATGEVFAVDQESSEVLLNDGQGHFELTYLQDPLRRIGKGDVPSGASFVDFDLDGNLDLWLSQGGLGAPLQDRLYKNMGRGEYQDWTENAGLITKEWEDLNDLNEGKAHTTAWSATACDLNGDGYSELLAASYGRAPNHLWKSKSENNAIAFDNISVASGYAFDGNQDWTGDQFARCYCEFNRDAEDCAMVPSADLQCDPNQINWDHSTGREAFRLGGNSGATLCDDFDNDGDLDLYTTEIHHWWGGVGSDESEILVNDGTAHFERPGRSMTGMTILHSTPDWDEGHITAGSLDFDNDGYQDIYLGATDYPGNRGRLYHNVSGFLASEHPMFEEVGIEDGFENNRSHGVAIADFDRDGDSDMIVGHSLMRCYEGENPCYATAQIRYFENKIGQNGNWIQLKLEGNGIQSNRFAVGAKIIVRTANDLNVIKHIQGGYGHFGQQQDHLVQIGLGAECTAQVEIHWPDRAQSVDVLMLDANKRYLVKQGQEAVVIE